MLQPFRWIKLLSTFVLALSIFLAFSGLALAQNTTVTATDPLTNKVAVPLTQTLAITFNQTINAATVHSGNLVVQGMMSGVLTGTYAVNGAQVTITPTRSFFPNELVRTTVTSGTQALNGDASVPYQWQFSAGEVRERCVAGFRNINAGLTDVSFSSVAWGDYDNDGDLDILISGIDNNGAVIAKIYRNDNGSFTDINAGLTGVSYSSVAWGDYDNDGDLDILLAGESSNRYIARVYRNDNDSFTNISANLPGLWGSSVAWGDYDNDGDLDILITGSDSNNVKVADLYRNDNGSFSNSNAGLTGVWYGSVAWGDYDNDGDLDILLAGWSNDGYIARIYRNDNGSFSNINANLPGVSYSSVAWGDYDNDGDLDILLAGYSSSVLIAQVYRNDNGSFSNSNAGLTGVYFSSVDWGDYDNDGDLDILLAGYSSSVPIAQIYRNHNSSFTNISAGLTGVYLSSVAWGDYDNDGDLDILLSGENFSGRVAQVYRNGDCPVADAGADQTVSVNTPLTLNGAASLDPQGGLLSYGWNTSDDPSLSFSPNLSITTFSASSVPGVLTFTLTITTSEGYTATDSTMVTVTEIAISALQAMNDSPTQLGVGTNLSATVSSGSNVSYSWDFGDSTSGNGAQVNHSYANIGSYSATVTAINSTSAVSTTTLVTVTATVVTATDPTTHAVGVALTQTLAITFDQALNVATVNSGTVVMQGMMGGVVTGTYAVNGAQVTITPTRSFFPNELVRTTVTSGTQSLNGDATVPYQWQFSAGEVRERCVAGFTDSNAGLTGVYFSSAAWGDYDNDGDLDVLITGRDSNSTQHADLYRNDNGSFTNIDAGLTGVRYSSVAWGDYDNDGDLDILITGNDKNFTKLADLYRNDNGSFINSNAGLTSVYYSSVAWGDYDNDGDLDILLSGNSSNGRVAQIYRNDNGTFTDINAGLTGAYFGGIVWGDYDNDGDLDILLTGGSSNGLVAQVYRNDNGSFTNINAGLTGVYQSSADWGDYDNDGDLDILITGRDSKNAALADLYRNDNGAFTDIKAGLTGVVHGSVDWGDVDNDGDLDILITGSDSSNNKLADLYRNDNGNFTHINAGLPGVVAGSVAWGDIDNDGDLDILLSGDSASGLIAQVYRNGDCPVADAGVDQTVSVNAPLTLNGAASLDLNGGTLSYGWSTNAAPALSFSRNLSITTFSAPSVPGVLTFTLTITTSEGYTATDSVVITVSDIAISALQATNDSPTQLGVGTNLSATVSSGSNVSYSWDFGDGNSGSGAQVNHSYTNVGSYTTTVTTSNSVSSFSTTTLVTIIDVPLAHHQSITINEDASIAITLTANDVDGSQLGFQWVELPAHGQLTGIAPNLRYTPTANFNGSDSFTFHSNDGQFDSDLATVTITVTAVNDIPLAYAQALTPTEDTPFSIILTGSDVDLDDLDFSFGESPLHGQLAGVAPNLRYTPTANFNGSDSFTFRANDGNADSALATVMITITPVDDAPVVVVPLLSTNEDATISITLPISDADGDILTYVVTTPPLHGTVSGGLPNFIYTPDANFHGQDSVTFSVTDGESSGVNASNANTTASITVTLQVLNINDAPLASNQTITITSENQVDLILFATDADGDSLHYQVVEQPTHGQLSGSAPNLIYTMAVNFAGTDRVTFKVNDGQVDSALGTITIVAVRPTGLDEESEPGGPSAIFLPMVTR